MLDWAYMPEESAVQNKNLYNVLSFWVHFSSRSHKHILNEQEPQKLSKKRKEKKGVYFTGGDWWLL